MDNKENNIMKNIDKDNQIVKENMITNIETKDNTWPETGYIFNDVLSGCEKGGELEYNSQNNTVNLLSNSSDRCYVYFDKYDGVWIDNVSITNVTGSSVTLDVSATSENGSITTYYYVLNDSEEYQESTSNIITINDLNKLAEYKVSIYCLDSTNAKSNIYELSISTTDESRPVINSVEVSNISDKGFTLTVKATSDIEIERYYYIIESENISGTNTASSYIFDNLKDGTNYNISIFVEDINGVFSSKYNLNVTTDKLSLVYNSQGSNDLYYHNNSLANGAGDNSYRYSGANPNNYICFGSDENYCPTDNLYRIIGIFENNIKLIKNISIGNFIWNSELDNTWLPSKEIYPDIKNTVNSTFLSDLDHKWLNIIKEHEWHVGGMDWNSSYTAKNYYDREIGINSNNILDNMKIGLMYVSDYGFAASNNYWDYSLYNYSNTDIRENNWMFIDISEWTISRYYTQDRAIDAFYVRSDGSFNGANFVTGYNNIRPCFYLNSNVEYSSGNGTQSDPFRIKL